MIGNITRRYGLFLHSRGNAHDQVVDIRHDLLDLGNLCDRASRGALHSRNLGANILGRGIGLFG